MWLQMISMAFQMAYGQKEAIKITKEAVNRGDRRTEAMLGRLGDVLYWGASSLAILILALLAWIVSQPGPTDHTFVWIAVLAVLVWCETGQHHLDARTASYRQTIKLIENLESDLGGADISLLGSGNLCRMKCNALHYALSRAISPSRRGAQDCSRRTARPKGQSLWWWASMPWSSGSTCCARSISATCSAKILWLTN
jgi:hypothetical protein